MTEKEFVDMILKNSINNKHLETKVKKKKQVYVQYKCKILKLDLISIVIFPYGSFEVGKWNGEKHKYRTTLYWKDYGKTWALTKEELL